MSRYLSPGSRFALERLLAGDDADPDGLQRLRDIRSALAALEAEDATLVAVRSALADGRSWAEIADAAGLGVAAATWRWRGSDAEIVARHAAGRARAARPSSVPTDLPGLSVADMASKLGVTPQAVYQRITRGLLTATTVELPDGRRYKRVVEPAEDGVADTSPGA